MSWLGKLISGRELRGELGALIDAYLREALDNYWEFNLRKIVSGAKLLALPLAEQVRAIRLVLEDDIDRGPADGASRDWQRRRKREKLVSELCRKALPFTLEDARALFARYSDVITGEGWVQYRALPKAIARTAETGGWLAALRPDLEQLRDVLSRTRAAEYAETRKLVKELDFLIAQAAGRPPEGFRIERDIWGERAAESLRAMEEGLREQWLAVLSYCASAKGSAPAARWLRAGEEVIAAALGKERFAQLAREWLGLLAGPVPKRDADHGAQRAFLISEGNADALKGVAWLLTHEPTEASARALGDAAAAAFRKIPNYGARSVKVGNACLQALKGFPGVLGARELAQLRARVKLPSQAAAIEKALAECADRLGVGIAETEELATPDHDFANGRRTLQFGDIAADLAIEGTSVVVAWRGADGEARKSEPAEVKRAFPEERKALKRLVEDVEKTLVALRDRLERAPIARREWPIDTWRQRYLDHALAGAFTHRLIWRFQVPGGEQPAVWIAGYWRDETGAPVDIAGATAVLPWHPIFAGAESVRRWRALLSQHGIVQPFKQAHREVYLLTDAERNTCVYSNRFAAHVLRQHQLANLCKARGWSYRLQGGFDSHNYPELSLPQWDLRAEYWVEAPGDQVDLSPSGIFLHVLTDQVRFSRAAAGARVELLPLEEIPPLAFSEVMRDVDLFVGVCSVGNDPTWQDGGPQGRFAAYWGSYAWSELSAFGESRREALAEILPRLTALRDIACIDGKFLRVKGKLREYKIHLGSGNILMEPNDQYLCIVPDRREKSGPRLQFDGDDVLSVILSKAFLLAKDDEIEDATILRQIK